jgi:hypothetical protein
MFFAEAAAVCGFGVGAAKAAPAKAMERGMERCIVAVVLLLIDKSMKEGESNVYDPGPARLQV